MSLVDNAASGLNVDNITRSDSGSVGICASVIENCQTKAPKVYLMTLLKGQGLCKARRSLAAYRKSASNKTELFLTWQSQPWAAVVFPFDNDIIIEE